MAFISIILIFLVLLVFSLLDYSRSDKIKITPVLIFITFTALAHLASIIYLFNDHYLNEYVLYRVHASFRSTESISFIYLLYLLSVTISVSFVYIGYYGKFHRLQRITSKILLFDREISERKAFRLGIILIIFGIFFYLYFINKIGGLSFLWSQLHLRTQLTAGYGYISLTYTSFLTVGFLLAYKSLLKKSKILTLLIALLIVFIFGSLSQRGPVIGFLFSCMLYHNYKIKPIKKVFSPKTIILFTFSFVIMISMSQFRSSDFRNEFKEDPSVLLVGVSDSVMKNLVLRMGALERHIVIVEYFSNNNLWWGASYISLIYAPIPSNMIDNKPPLDTGVYLYNIANGADITPPKPIDDMLRTSWPEGNWAGYMNFGVPGLLIFSAFSAWLYGFIGRLIIVNNFNTFATIFFVLIAFGGSITLSPYGIFGFLGTVAPVYLISLLALIRFRSKN